MAFLMPCLSRDGTLFCWYARDLGREGLTLLQRPETQQHPLYPALVLGTQRIAARLGFAESPLLWQRSGQFVSLVSGVAVVLLTAWLTHRLTARLQPSIDSGRAAVFAGLLAGLLPLNVWLSADVMSDQAHLAFYLAAVICLIRLDSIAIAALCGFLSGLAFLTREEGVIPFAGAVVVLVARSAKWRFGRVARLMAALLVGFIACAGPFWTATGKFSLKKAPAELFGIAPGHGRGFGEGASNPGSQAAGRHDGPVWAALLTRDVPWHRVVPETLYETFRAGRVVVPLLGVIGLLRLRSKVFREPLLGITLCIGAQFTLAMLVLHKWDYLSPRHMLPIVALLVPFGAMFLSEFTLARRHEGAAAGPVFTGSSVQRMIAGLTLTVTVLVLAAYSLRVPNSRDAFLREAADRLRQNDPAVQDKLLLCGSSPRRVAFYAGMRHQPWPENERDYTQLADHILHFRPDYFAVETGPGQERSGNEDLVARLQADARIAPFATMIEGSRTPQGDGVLVFRFVWP